MPALPPDPPAPPALDHLFRHEAGRLIAVLARLFGFERLEVAEDLVQDTFMQAYETWRLRGLPANPTAWLYQVAKNKAYTYVQRQRTFAKATADLRLGLPEGYTIQAHIEAAFQALTDSQLQMLFAVCHPRIPPDAQVALALKTLCGFSVGEVAAAFLTTPETITKRLYRAKEKIRQERLNLDFPPSAALPARLNGVLRCIYLLFNEGYYSASPDAGVRHDLCREALRLGLLLLDAPVTRQPAVHALLALMCFHASRLNGRTAPDGSLLPWHDQDRSRWEPALIAQGIAYLNAAAEGPDLTTYHLEAMIAYHHTQPDTPAKWPALLPLFDQLLLLQPSPLVALSRAYALGQVGEVAAAIAAAKQVIELKNSVLYHALLGELYETLDQKLAARHWQQALALAPGEPERATIGERLRRCRPD